MSGSPDLGPWTPVRPSGRSRSAVDGPSEFRFETSLFQFVIFFIFVFKFWGSFIFICLCEVKDVKTRS